ncbi:capsule assembly Wzi family protein [Geobacter sp.]|uniref:capsule assembly Wzi family protein n=1 Tax=Geobacter sp. TaxID=46610 RepID=UPI00261B2B57|nr:capsule assembly Wzi family protein [Geobacter sp.]
MSHHNSSLFSGTRTLRVVSLALLALLLFAANAFALSSPNIPLDSPIYAYLEKLSGAGLIRSDFRGIRPFSKAEAARLVLEAEAALKERPDVSALASEVVQRLKELLPREYGLYREEKAPFLDYNLVASSRLRYVYLDGTPRSYERPVHDPGNDGVFGIGSGLRPPNPYPSIALQHGTEGTPFLPNNEGIVYRDGHNAELRFSSEAYLGRQVSALIEPLFVYRGSGGAAQLLLNKGYVKLGGGGLELEVGRDANWLGLGTRGAITLTDNARNFDLIKLSSPEPLSLGSWGMVKYSLIASRFDRTVTDGAERQPWFYALKLSYKPASDWEIGFNLGRQVGGPGVNNSFGDTLRGIIGGTSADNSNGLAGIELRYRASWLRNTEFYGEFSGEDTAAFWPIVESYVAGFYIPRLTDSGRDDLRFEFFKGNNILYTNGTFPEGYLYRGMPIGHSQGGATIEFYLRYSHWFSPRNILALELYRTDRGHEGRVEVNGVRQGIERKHAGTISWNLPLAGDVDLNLMYGREQISNFNLANGVDQTNQLFKAEMSYRY